MHIRRSPDRWSRGVVAAVVVTFGVAGTALGQKPARPGGSATLVGRVMDTTGTTLADAEVIVTLTRDSNIVKTVTSDARGDVVVRDLLPGGPYTIVARKIGYGSARGTDVHLKAGDTLRVDFELPATGVTLPTITVTARNSPRAITADQFNPRQHRDALAVLAWKRPYMLGDPDRCRAPAPPPWPVPSSRGTGRRPWVDASRFFDVFNPPYSPYVERVYVNGARVDVPGQSPLVTLHEIPSDQIAEMRYVDCVDPTVFAKRNKETPVVWPYSIYITLKSPSREVQDSVLRAIRRGAARR